jgi:hypothetical protein
LPRVPNEIDLRADLDDASAPPPQSALLDDLGTNVECERTRTIGIRFIALRQPRGPTGRARRGRNSGRPSQCSVPRARA